MVCVRCKQHRSPTIDANNASNISAKPNQMPWKLTIRIGELLVTAALAVAIIAAWRAERADRAQLAAELAAAKQSLTQADDRQHTRDSQLL